VWRSARRKLIKRNYRPDRAWSSTENHALRHAQWVAPGKDHPQGTQFDTVRDRGDIAEELKVETLHNTKLSYRSPSRSAARYAWPQSIRRPGPGSPMIASTKIRMQSGRPCKRRQSAGRTAYPCSQPAAAVSDEKLA